MEIEPIRKRIAAGDTQAFADVVRHYQRPLFGFLGRMTLSQAHAEDIAQQTFLRAWRNLGAYRPEVAEFSTWLFAIARNLALNELARAAASRESGGVEELTELACERPQPPEQLEQAQRRRQLRRALQCLPASDRNALALAHVRELDLAAIARIEQCSTGAIKTRLHRARDKLRRLLEKEDG